MKVHYVVTDLDEGQVEYVLAALIMTDTRITGYGDYAVPDESKDWVFKDALKWCRPVAEDLKRNGNTLEVKGIGGNNGIPLLINYDTICGGVEDEFYNGKRLGACKGWHYMFVEV